MDKSLFASKTFWLNAVAVVVSLAGVFGFDLDLSPERQAEIAGIIVSLVGVANVVLRTFTGKPITGTAQASKLKEEVAKLARAEVGRMSTNDLKAELAKRA